MSDGIYRDGLAWRGPNLCEGCQYRANSRKKVIDAKARYDANPEEWHEKMRTVAKSHPKATDIDPEKFKVWGDITPKAECKWHDGYGMKNQSKDACFDFMPLEVAAKTPLPG